MTYTNHVNLKTTLLKRVQNGTDLVQNVRLKHEGMYQTRLRDQVKISGAFCTYVALATAVLHCLGWMTVAPERDEAGLGPVHVRKYRY